MNAPSGWYGSSSVYRAVERSCALHVLLAVCLFVAFVVCRSR